MSFFDRFKGLLSEESGPRREDPQRAINKLVRELRRSVSEGRARLASAARDARKLDLECRKLEREIRSEQAQARRLLTQGDEAGARAALSRRVRAEGLHKELRHEHVRQIQVLRTLQESLKELSARVKACEVRRTKLQARARRARALQARAKAMEDGRLRGVEGLLEDLSTRLEVEEELLAAGSAGDSLERRFAELEASGEFQMEQLEELEELRKSLPESTD
jgi:phage shock protein A